jgi:hypothetical protein
MIKNWRYRQMIETTTLALAAMAIAAGTMALPACSHDGGVATNGQDSLETVVDA